MADLTDLARMLEREIAALKAQLVQARDDEARKCAWLCGNCAAYHTDWDVDREYHRGALQAATDCKTTIERSIRERASLKRVQP